MRRRAIVNDRLETLDVYAVTLLAADRDVITDFRAQRAQGLHQQGGGGLPIHIEVAPDADDFVPACSQIEALDCSGDARVRCGFEVGKRCRGEFVGMEKGAGGGRVAEAACRRGSAR